MEENKPRIYLSDATRYHLFLFRQPGQDGYILSELTTQDVKEGFANRKIQKSESQLLYVLTASYGLNNGCKQNVPDLQLMLSVTPTYNGRNLFFNMTNIKDVGSLLQDFSICTINGLEGRQVRAYKAEMTDAAAIAHPDFDIAKLIG